MSNGGTGATSLTSGQALIGNGTGAVTTKAITDITSTAGDFSTTNTNLITARTLAFGINRTNSVAVANTAYATYMARGEALNSADTNPTANGAISWTYE